MEIQIEQQIKQLAPGLCLGVAIIHNACVAVSNTGLSAEYATLQEMLAKQYHVEKLNENHVIQSVRQMYKLLNMDPGRYRPASEAMLRRVLQGKGLPSINTAVDVNNMGSLHWGIPSGVYNLSRVTAPVTLRLGREHELYEGITGNQVSAQGKLVLADSEKIMGSPTTDSQDTRVEPGVTQLMLVQYIPSGWPSNAEEALNWVVERLIQYNGGTVVLQKLIQ